MEIRIAYHLVVVHNGLGLVRRQVIIVNSVLVDQRSRWIAATASRKNNIVESGSIRPGGFVSKNVIHLRSDECFHSPWGVANLTPPPNFAILCILIINPAKYNLLWENHIWR